MFNNLVESTTGKKDDAAQGRFLGITTLLYSVLVLTLFAWSIWTVVPSIDSQDLELTTLVAPVPVQVPEPPKPKTPEEKPKTTTSVDLNKQVDVRPEIIQNMNESPTKPPTQINTSQSAVPERRQGVTTIQGSKVQNAEGGGVIGPKSSPGASGGGGAPPRQATPPPAGSEGPKPPPPPPTPKPAPTPEPTAKPVPKVVSGGVLNGKATSLPQPAYPPAAKAVRAAGSVSVAVQIDENGNVISASATSGHPLLKAAAEAAARRAKFSPTTLSGQAVKVNGTIVYNFVL